MTNQEHGQVGSGQGEDSKNYDITPPEQRETQGEGTTPAQPADPHDDSRD